MYRACNITEYTDEINIKSKKALQARAVCLIRYRKCVILKYLQVKWKSICKQQIQDNKRKKFPALYKHEGL